jgi:hypothetical protein
MCRAELLEPRSTSLEVLRQPEGEELFAVGGGLGADVHAILRRRV